jgi:CMP-N,N'-diacetyllegionaminic acid synthase
LFNGQSILAVIPARGGSKGVPRKNIRQLGGKPLLAWTIDSARKSKHIDRVVLSSEDEEIMRVAQQYGCEVPFSRPAELAEDDTPGIAPVLHVLEVLGEEYDYLVLLQPTSPFRTAEDIDGAIERCIDGGAESCVSVVEVSKHPAWMFSVSSEGVLASLPYSNPLALIRQELDKVYALNGAIYVSSTSSLRLSGKLFIADETLAYPMPLEHSMDVDTELDFMLCELIAERLGKADVL